MSHRYTDPEGAAEIWKARYAEAVRAFKTREISQDVFGASLHSLGFTPSAIQTEINLNYPTLRLVQ